MKINNLRASIMALTFLFFLSSSQPIFASSQNVQAYIERQTFFNNTTDFFATLGKSKSAKVRIKKNRRWARRKARLKQIRA